MALPAVINNCGDTDITTPPITNNLMVKKHKLYKRSKMYNTTTQRMSETEITMSDIDRSVAISNQLSIMTATAIPSRLQSHQVDICRCDCHHRIPDCINCTPLNCKCNSGCPKLCCTAAVAAINNCLCKHHCRATTTTTLYCGTNQIVNSSALESRGDGKGSNPLRRMCSGSDELNNKLTLPAKVKSTNFQCFVSPSPQTILLTPTTTTAATTSSCAVQGSATVLTSRHSVDDKHNSYTIKLPNSTDESKIALKRTSIGIWAVELVFGILSMGFPRSKSLNNNMKQQKYQFFNRLPESSRHFYSLTDFRWPNLNTSIILIVLLFFALLSPSTSALSAFETSLQTDLNRRNETVPVKLSRIEKVCKSLDIRNTADQLRQLENCTVIEGFLLLTLITTRGPNEFTQSFPLLTEVTEFIIVYQINNLRSLAQIFPNLSVIRGRHLFEGYALVVHSNIHLEELGLSKLTTISRGGVRIEKNVMLCYVTTVDWKQIVTDPTDIFIEDNRDPIECPSCPGDHKNSAMDLVCKEHLGRRNCWNSSTCQKICPERCRHNCLDETTCCNESCLGGCSPHNPNECAICRHFSINNDTCIDKCPENGYNYLGRRCLTAEACLKLRYKYQDGKPQEVVPFGGRCTTVCPEGYNKMNSTCVKCGDNCRKECPGTLIDSVAVARDFHGCTDIVKNGLTIIIKRGSRHLIEDLEYGLSSIQVISTFLQIQGTFGMLNLHFFKNLHTIKGEKLVENQYAFYVLENSDMESIWAVNQTVRIENGTVYFHFNPKLCLNEIEKLLPMMKNQTKFDKNEVSQDSNGSRGTCNTVFLNVTIDRLNATLAIVNILNPMKFEDERTFIGYQYLHIEDNDGNATEHGYRPCDDGWIASLPTKDTKFIFMNLKPYTRYAFYVKTMTISTERRNAQSPIKRFKTLAGQPQFIRGLEAKPISSSAIKISWLPPLTANGKLVKYKIRASNIQSYETRNYCKAPLKESANPKNDNRKTESPKTEKPDNCKCSKDTPYHDEKDDGKILDSIEFENSLQNFIYVKNTKSSSNKTLNYSRRKRSVEGDEEVFESFLLRHTRDTLPSTYEDNNASMAGSLIENNTRVRDDGTLEVEVNASVTEYVFTNLKHFSMYTFAVEACREPEKEASEKDCSIALKHTSRTLMLDDVDKVEDFRAQLERTNTTRSNIVLFWKRPSRPNGAVVSYTISYELQTQDAVEEKKCITEADFIAFNYERLGYVLSGLLTGNYSVRIRANSLAGEGKYSNTLYVYIPPITPSPALISGIVLATIILLTLIFGIVYIVYRKKFRKEPADVKIFPFVNPFYASIQYVADEWEVPRDRVIQLSSLGQGSFGMVYEGILRGIEESDKDMPCAIKTVNESATERERMNFLNEASVMKQFDTYHVVHLLGVCSQGQPALVVMELMKNGDLKSYLRAHRPEDHAMTDVASIQRPSPPPLSRIYQMAIEIADGMAYLSGKKFVHRDLAARNCMVAEDLTVKIGDFGMTRDIYETDYYRKGSKGLLPVRWMAPESLRDGVYSTASDVFSYGVVLWEMATLASQPYQGLSNDQVLRYVIEGGVMERPENCPDILYNLMQKCWKHRPSARPTFMDMIHYLENLSKPNFCKVSFYHSEEGQQIIAKEMAEKTKRSGDVHDLGEEYNHYNFRIDNDSSVENKDENLLSIEAERQDSSSSLGSAIMVSNSIQQQDDVDVYVLPDYDGSSTLKPSTTNEQGYELYDPSPSYSEMEPVEKSSDKEGYDEIHSMTARSNASQRQTTTNAAPSIMPLSSSVPDEIINLPAASSLHPSTASAASSTASSRATISSRYPNLKMVTNSLKPVRMRVKNMRFFNQKRSGSNASDNSNNFILKNITGYGDEGGGGSGSGDGDSNYQNQTGSFPRQNLGTIESGSAGNFCAAPRFFTPTISSSSDHGNYRRLDESLSKLETEKLPSAVSAFTISTNPNYQKLDESFNTSATVTTPVKRDFNTSENPNYLPVDVGDTAQYIVYDPEQQQPQQQMGVKSSNSSTLQISDNPNYKMMGPTPLYASTTYSIPSMTTMAPRTERVSHPKRDHFKKFSATPSTSSSSDHTTEEEDEEDYEADEGIKMDRIPLRRRSRNNQAQRKCSSDRSRSRSSSSHSHIATPLNTPTASSGSGGGVVSGAQFKTNMPASTFSLKEKWLKQQQQPPPPPPPNGFVGREA